jgi:hypothetical protein
MNQVLSAFPTGSFVICDPPVLDTDIDVVWLVKDFAACSSSLQADGWEICGEEYSDADGTFKAWRKENLNYILVTDKNKFAEWIVATNLAKQLNLLNKEDRIALFSVIRNFDEKIKEAAQGIKSE